MRRLFLVLVVALLAFGAVTYAAPLDELHALARYYPENTLAFGSVRTDEGLFTDVDGLLAHVMNFLPPGALPPVTTADLVDQAVRNMGLEDFETNIRPWLGESVSAGLWAGPEGMNGDPYILLAIAADGAAARTFFEELAAPAVQDGAVERIERDGFLMYVQDSSWNPLVIAINDEAVFFTQAVDMLPIDLGATLADSAVFTESFSLLPAGDYGMAGFLNMPVFQSMMAEEMAMLDLPEFYMQAYEAAGAMAIGATQIDNTLLIDLGVVNNTGSLAEMGLANYIPRPVGMGIANHVPADAPFVMLGSEPGPSLQSLFDQVRAIDGVLEEMGGLASLIDPEGYMYGEMERAAIDAIDPSLILSAFSVPFAGATGLSLESDVFPVMDGDSAAFLRVLSVDDFTLAPISPDLGMVFMTSNPDGAANIVSHLAESARSYDFPLPVEPYGNGEAVVLPLHMLVPEISYPNLDLMIGASDNLLVMGTRPAMGAALGESGGLADNDHFQRASQYFLDGSQQIMYFSSTPLFDLVDHLGEIGMIPVDAETSMIYTAASVVESASLTTAGSDKSVVIRAAITLAPQPRNMAGTGQ